jgi:hypothetical protein
MNNKYNLKINGDNNFKNEEVVVIMAGKNTFNLFQNLTNFEVLYEHRVMYSEPHKLRSLV